MHTIFAPGRALLVVASLLAAALPAAAQRQSDHDSAARRSCDRVATTSISFGHVGGTLKPTGLRIAADGRVHPVGGDSAARHAPRAVSTRELRRLVRRGWTKEFMSLPTAPTRPTRNPDAARDFIELRSACGSKHVEYPGGEGPPPFRELYRELERLTGVR